MFLPSYTIIDTWKRKFKGTTFSIYSALALRRFAAKCNGAHCTARFATEEDHTPPLWKEGILMRRLNHGAEISACPSVTIG